jgi:hypothetical protein
MEIVDVLAKMDEHLARQDLMLEKMDERSARLAELMAQCHHEATAAHQAAATAMSRYAEVNLSVEAFLTVARELLAEWRRQRQRP